MGMGCGHPCVLLRDWSFPGTPKSTAGFWWGCVSQISLAGFGIPSRGKTPSQDPAALLGAGAWQCRVLGFIQPGGGGFAPSLSLSCQIITLGVPGLAGEKGEQGLSPCPAAPGAPHGAALVKSLFQSACLQLHSRFRFEIFHRASAALVGDANCAESCRRKAQMSRDLSCVGTGTLVGAKLCPVSLQHPELPTRSPQGWR